MLFSQLDIVGNPSQADYNAANVLLDAFADYRNYQGLPAIKLHLGRVVELSSVVEIEGGMRDLCDLPIPSIGREEVMTMIKCGILTTLRQPGPGSRITGLKS